MFISGNQNLDLGPDRLSKSRGPDPGSCNIAKGYLKKIWSRDIAGMDQLQNEAIVQDVWLSYILLWWMWLSILQWRDKTCLRYEIFWGVRLILSLDVPCTVPYTLILYLAVFVL